MDSVKTALLKARQQFKGQKAKVSSTGFDNSPFVEGTHPFDVVDAKVTMKEREGVETPVFYTRLQCTAGQDNGKSAFPFAPALNTPEGISSAAGIVRSILGDVVPGNVDNADQSFVVDIPSFLDKIEDFAFKCIGQKVEARMANRRAKIDGSHLKDDGTCWQNCYIQRGLGEDKAPSSPKAQSREPDDLNMGSTSPAKKSAAKVDRRKAVRR